MVKIRISSPFGWNQVSYDFIKTMVAAVMPDATLGKVVADTGIIELDLSRAPTAPEIEACRSALLSQIISVEVV